MVRNRNRSGFSPENVGAGLDDMLDPAISIPVPENDSVAIEKQTIEEKNEKEQLTETLEQSVLQSDVDVVEDNIVDESDDKNFNSSTSLGDILSNNDSYDKKQTLVYLSKETRTILEALGKFVGKKNGGKSFIVEDALNKYFELNKDYVDEAVKKYGKKTR